LLCFQGADIHNDVEDAEDAVAEDGEEVLAAVAVAVPRRNPTPEVSFIIFDTVRVLHFIIIYIHSKILKTVL
jgi:hypothetical protein